MSFGLLLVSLEQILVSFGLLLVSLEQILVSFQNMACLIPSSYLLSQ
ncbi:hypothetical protein LJR015_000184 [Peribacillus frigoritolerans]